MADSGKQRDCIQTQEDGRGKSQNNFVEVRMSGSSVKQRRGGVEGVNYKATIL